MVEKELIQEWEKALSADSDNTREDSVREVARKERAGDVFLHRFKGRDYVVDMFDEFRDDIKGRMDIHAFENLEEMERDDIEPFDIGTEKYRLFMIALIEYSQEEVKKLNMLADINIEPKGGFSNVTEEDTVYWESEDFDEYNEATEKHQYIIQKLKELKSFSTFGKNVAIGDTGDKSQPYAIEVIPYDDEVKIALSAQICTYLYEEKNDISEILGVEEGDITFSISGHNIDGLDETNLSLLGQNSVVCNNYAEIYGYPNETNKELVTLDKDGDIKITLGSCSVGVSKEYFLNEFYDEEQKVIDTQYFKEELFGDNFTDNQLIEQALSDISKKLDISGVSLGSFNKESDSSPTVDECLAKVEKQEAAKSSVKTPSL